MPRGDRTGPEGFGPRTGRSLGYCSGYDSPGFAHGRGCGGRHEGFGSSQGRGYGFRRMRFLGPFNSHEKRYSEEESMKSLKDEINSVEKYLQELKEIEKNRAKEE